jgi:hypothetical protein
VIRIGVDMETKKSNKNYLVLKTKFDSENNLFTCFMCRKRQDSYSYTSTECCGTLGVSTNSENGCWRCIDTSKHGRDVC